MPRLIACLAIVALASPAHAQRVWVCSYPSLINPNTPVIERYTIQGGEIVPEQLNARFRVLKDDAYAVIGSWIPPAEPTARANYTADVFLVLIDKQSRHLRFARLGAAPGDSTTAEGSCLPGR